MQKPSRFAILAAFAAVYLIWGSTYLFIRFAIDSIPPFLIAGSRYLTAGFLMYAIARMQGATRPSAGTWRPAFVIGVCCCWAKKTAPSPCSNTCWKFPMMAWAKRRSRRHSCVLIPDFDALRKDPRFQKLCEEK